jgi:ABC-2 type transport system permease protein
MAMSSMPEQSPHPELAPRPIGRINWIGLAALVRKEVRRFLTVWVQTVGAPMVTTLLFLAVFTLALGRALQVVGGVPFTQFLAPGLIMMAMIQNAFANSSSSIVSSKMQGNIVDIVMAPLSPIELTIGYGLGGMVRGLMVGAGVALAMSLFVPITIVHPFHALFFAAMASLMLSLLGVVGGIWADKHEQNAAVTNFIITPLAFLSGTFYSIDRLPGIWNTAARMDPFFYMIDGFRYAFTGHSDAPLVIGYAIMLAGNLGLGLLAWALFRSGYRLRA